MLYSQNLQKQTRIFFQNGGGGARCAGPGSAFDSSITARRNFLILYRYEGHSVIQFFFILGVMPLLKFVMFATGARVNEF